MEEFPSNTKKAAVPEKAEKQAQITTGPVILKKKSLGSRFKDAFTGEDGRSVMQHVLWDVLVPSAKDMVADAGQEAINRALYGDSRTSRRPNATNYAARSASVLASRVNYSSPSALIRDPRDAPKSRQQETAPTRGRIDFQEIVLSTRVEAESVIIKMHEFIEQFEQATIADLFDLVGVTGEYTDERFGWVNLEGARPRKVRDGYLLDLPNPIQLTK